VLFVSAAVFFAVRFVDVEKRLLKHYFLVRYRLRRENSVKSKKNLSVKTAGMIVGALALIVLAGCGSAGAGDGTGLTKEQAAQATAEAFAAMDEAYEEVPNFTDPDCITFDGDTVYFNNCVFDGVSLDGQMTVTSLTDTTFSSSGSLVLAGPGIPQSPLSVSWSILITTSPSFAISGQITVAGTTYSYDELGVPYGAY
jgi:hypothetical protein